MASDWLLAVMRGNAWHGPEEFERPVARTVSVWARLVRRVRAFVLWGR